jgi:hypothetical protein
LLTGESDSHGLGKKKGLVDMPSTSTTSAGNATKMRCVMYWLFLLFLFFIFVGEMLLMFFDLFQ